MSEDRKFDEYLERRAEQLGLPTDPEAYQDGGLAVAATARNLFEAEALAMCLKSRDIPAWVDSPLSALYSDGYVRPTVAVLVPLGRLADAQKLIAEEGKAEAISAAEAIEAQPAQEETRGEDEEQEEEQEERPARWGSARIFAVVMTAGFLLCLIFGLIAAAYILVNELLR